MIAAAVRVQRAVADPDEPERRGDHLRRRIGDGSGRNNTTLTRIVADVDAARASGSEGPRRRDLLRSPVAYDRTSILHTRASSMRRDVQQVRHKGLTDLNAVRHAWVMRVARAPTRRRRRERLQNLSDLSRQLATACNDAATRQNSRVVSARRVKHVKPREFNRIFTNRTACVKYN